MPVMRSFFTTEMYPEAMQRAAWRDALGEISLGVGALNEQASVFGTIISVASPSGIVFSRLTSCSQQLKLGDRNTGAIWLALQQAGKGEVTQGGTALELVPGDIAYGPFSTRTEIRFDDNFRQLFVSVPPAVLAARSAAKQSSVTGLPSHSGIGHVLASLLRSVSDNIGRLTDSEVWPVESAFLELLLTTLATDSLTVGPTASTTSTTMSLHRVLQFIESRLSDADLSQAKIAKECGISPRYLQKLLQTSGTNFGNVVRQRRLERCRTDIVNPLYSHDSLSDICFRWGFSDSAHFSRAFRDQYGLSPRDYRRTHGVPAAKRIPLEFARSYPDGRQDPGSETTMAGRGLARPERLNKGSSGKRGDAATSTKPEITVKTSGDVKYHYVAVSVETVHWGYFSKSLQPVVEVSSGDIVTIETLTHHGTDDYDRMIKGDPGAESVFGWTERHKSIDRRGAGPVDASVYGRGAGEGFGVEICTGPIAIRNARPGDVVEIRIRDIRLRPCCNPDFKGRSFGSNAAAWWGLQYHQLLTEPRPREVVTIYEVHGLDSCDYATAIYNFHWMPQIDPAGVTHSKIDYPGVRVIPGTVIENRDILKGVRIPVRPHFGVIGLAPKEANIVDSTPPAYFGGNLDNWRAGKGARLYLPVSVPGGLLSVGDPHASQGDGELCGTAIECSLTGDFEVILHRKKDLGGTMVVDLNYPLLETPNEWIIHGFSFPNYLAELSETAQSSVYRNSTLDFAVHDAFRKARRFLMTTQRLSEDQAVSLISVAVDFGVTQVANGNWCVHAVIRKCLFPA